MDRVSELKAHYPPCLFLDIVRQRAIIVFFYLWRFQSWRQVCWTNSVLFSKKVNVGILDRVFELKAHYPPCLFLNIVHQRAIISLFFFIYDVSIHSCQFVELIQFYFLKKNIILTWQVNVGTLDGVSELKAHYPHCLFLEFVHQRAIIGFFLFMTFPFIFVKLFQFYFLKNMIFTWQVNVETLDGVSELKAHYPPCLFLDIVLQRGIIVFFYIWRFHSWRHLF